MKVEYGLQTDTTILQELGRCIMGRRIERNLTQAGLALQAGVSKRTVERLEAGESTQLANFLRILRALELLDTLDVLLPETGPGPMELLRHRGRERMRVRPKRTAEPKQPWTWGDEP